MKKFKIGNWKFEIGAAFVVAVLALPLLTGCAGYGAITRNLADNGAVGRVKMSSPWGPQEFTRSGQTTNTVVIEPDGRIIRVGDSATVVIEGSRVLINPIQRPAPGPTNQTPQVIFIPLNANGPLGQTGPTNAPAAQVGLGDLVPPAGTTNAVVTPNESK